MARMSISQARAPRATLGEGLPTAPRACFRAEWERGLLCLACGVQVDPVVRPSAPDVWGREAVGLNA